MEAKLAIEIANALTKFPNNLLTLSEVKELLKSLHVCGNSQSQDLHNDIFCLLDADSIGGASKKAIQTLLIALMKPRRSTSAGYKITKKLDKQSKLIGVYQQVEGGEEYILSDKEKDWLFSNIGLRMKCDRLSQKYIPSTKEVKHAFSPEINSYSQKIAHLAREKILKQIKSDEKRKVPLEDILLQHKKNYKKKLQPLLIAKEIEQEKKCTFKPKLISKPMSRKVSPVNQKPKIDLIKVINKKLGNSVIKSEKNKKQLLKK